MSSTDDAPEHADDQSPARVLCAILVYNGRSFVPRALESAARLQGAGSHHTDVLVLDDASPEPGFSDDLARWCADLGIACYRSPRNLGIPRNMNLGLLHAEEGGYDYVVILNSDVVLPNNLVDRLVAAHRSGPRIGTVTAWSNNASIFSLPNDDPDRHLADLATVDAVSGRLAEEFGDEVLDLPVGVGYCLSISREVIAEVGLFDPVFGRGYCEEVDLCRRAHGAGWRNVLALGVFAYHAGSATNREAGILQPGEQTVHTNERIIDQRYPTYRHELADWCAGDPMAPLVSRGLAAIVQGAAEERGALVEASWLRRVADDLLDTRVRIAIEPDGPSPLVEARVQGWRCPVPVGGDGILAGIAAFLGTDVGSVNLHDRGDVAERLAAEAAARGIRVGDLRRYPERV